MSANGTGNAAQCYVPHLIETKQNKKQGVNICSKIKTDEIGWFSAIDHV